MDQIFCNGSMGHAAKQSHEIMIEDRFMRNVTTITEAVDRMKRATNFMVVPCNNDSNRKMT